MCSIAVQLDNINNNNLGKYLLNAYYVPSFPDASHGKRVCLQWGRPEFYPCLREIPWRRKRQPSPVILSGEFHGQRSLAACSPRVSKIRHYLWLTLLCARLILLNITEHSQDAHENVLLLSRFYTWGQSASPRLKKCNLLMP